jgi:hypothetical protein
MRYVLAVIAVLVLVVVLCSFSSSPVETVERGWFSADTYRHEMSAEGNAYCVYVSLYGQLVLKREARTLDEARAIVEAELARYNKAVRERNSPKATTKEGQ